MQIILAVIGILALIWILFKLVGIELVGLLIEVVAEILSNLSN